MRVLAAARKRINHLEAYSLESARRSSYGARINPGVEGDHANRIAEAGVEARQVCGLHRVFVIQLAILHAKFNGVDRPRIYLIMALFRGGATV